MIQIRHYKIRLHLNEAWGLKFTMSYRDDEDFKDGDIEDEDDILAGSELDDSLSDDLLLDDADDEPMEGFAGIDGSEE